MYSTITLSRKTAAGDLTATLSSNKRIDQQPLYTVPPRVSFVANYSLSGFSLDVSSFFYFPMRKCFPAFFVCGLRGVSSGAISFRTGWLTIKTSDIKDQGGNVESRRATNTVLSESGADQNSWRKRSSVFVKRAPLSELPETTPTERNWGGAEGGEKGEGRG